MSRPCLARLTCWEDTNYEILPKKSVCYLSLCKRVAAEGKDICSDCEKRPRVLKDAQAAAKKPKGLCLDVPDGTLVFRRAGGMEFSASYNSSKGVLELADADKPIAWPASLPRIFPSPTLFGTTVGRAALGLEKKICVNGWDVCYIKDKAGKAIPLQKVRKEAPEPIHPQTLLYHGLLTEAQPSWSLIYKGPGYLAVCKETRNMPCDLWLRAAEKAHKEAEARCVALGKVLWRPSDEKKNQVKGVSNPVSKEESKVEEEEEEEMPPRKKAPAALAAPQKNTLLKSFPKIKKQYEEKKDTPTKLPTDFQEIWKEECDGQMYWFSDSGWIFSVEEDDEPGEICGKMDADGNIELYVE